MRALRRLLLLLALALALPSMAAAQPASVQEVDPRILLERWDADAAEVERELEGEDPTQSDYSELRTRLEEQAAKVPALLERAQKAAEPIRQQIEALGEPPEDGQAEAESVAAERERLKAELAEAEALIAKLNQAKARAETLIGRTIEKRRQLFTERLMTRGPSPLMPQTFGNGLAGLQRAAATIIGETRVRLAEHHFDGATLTGYVGALVGVLLVLVSLRVVREFAVRRLSRLLGRDATQARRVAVGVMMTLVRLLAPVAAILVVLVGARASGLVGAQGMQLMLHLGIAGAIWVAAWALSLAFFSPAQSKLRLSTLDDAAAARTHWWIMALAGTVALDQALVESGRDLGFALEALTVLNATFLVMGGIALWKVIRGIAPEQDDREAVDTVGEEDEEAAPDASRDFGMIAALAALARLLGRMSAVAAPLLALVGYFAASRYAFYPMVFSGAAICFCLLLYQVVQALVERLAPAAADGDTERQAAERERLRVIPVVVGFVLTSAALPVLALIWGASISDLGLVWRRLVEGVHVGDIRISPKIFLTFLIVFSIGFLLTRMLQSVLRRSVLPLTSLDTGGRDAIRAGVGYVGVTLAAVAAIASAGIDLSNLAIALGALSVGIGFGLQNVVNNFVSGIILLIERPIKTGDWVELASGMGYVKQINVRSTEIETFDRSSLIVPNSELISSAVVNWTHSNNNGRIIVPVSVAYGTDPRRVEKILLEIAKAHPMLLRRPAPYVLLSNFGENALQFEIRGVLRDVNWVLNAASDIRYEIAQRFDEEGIEIPFAQRDLRLRNAGELAEALGRQLSGAPADGGEAPPAPLPSAGGGRGVTRLRAADPSARELVKGPPPRVPDEPPWETLEDAGDEMREPPDKPEPREWRLGRAAGAGEAGEGGER